MAPDNPALVGRLKPAAQYLRMSTDHQRYSIEYQSIANAAYAHEHGLEIVKTYQDAGISGLSLEKRMGLKQLLSDVLGGTADFAVVLVYDVSRWGRFQDPDESAHYEFICKSAGVRVEYCAEAFANDGSVTAAMVKTLKRVMAAEFSRDLSDRVSRTKRGLGLKGFWMGGIPGFGLRRCPVDDKGNRWPSLELGETNARVGCRIILVPGPGDEVALVRRIFQMAVTGRLSPPKIAIALNAEGIACPSNTQWTDNNIRCVLRNELYIGTLVFGREKTRLGRWQREPEQAWIRVRNAFEAIVPERVFRKAARGLPRFQHRSKDELLTELRRVLADNGRLTSVIISNDATAPSASAYQYHFGSLRTAYALIGYQMDAWQQRSSDVPRTYNTGKCAWNDLRISDDETVRRLVELLERNGRLTLQSIQLAAGIPGPNVLIKRFGSMRRVYELAGYEPNARQTQNFERAELALRARADRTGGPKISIGS